MPCLDGCVCTVLPPLYCRGHARSLRRDHKDLWVVFFPRCTAGPKLVGSCCIRLHTTANTNATTPNIVGATMLGVVAPICTQPKTPKSLEHTFLQCPANVQFYHEILSWFNVSHNTLVTLSPEQIVMQKYIPCPINDNLRRRIDLLILFIKTFVWCPLTVRNL